MTDNTDALPPLPKGGKISLSLADLAVLADTAEKYGKRDAFVQVALEWAAQANMEIERLSAARFVGESVGNRGTGQRLPSAASRHFAYCPAAPCAHSTQAPNESSARRGSSGHDATTNGLGWLGSDTWGVVEQADSSRTAAAVAEYFPGEHFALELLADGDILDLDLADGLGRDVGDLALELSGHLVDRGLLGDLLVPAGFLAFEVQAPSGDCQSSGQREGESDVRPHHIHGLVPFRSIRSTWPRIRGPKLMCTQRPNSSISWSN